MDEMNDRHSDFEWLQQFARSGNQNAFREIVRRHIDLVLATAKRKWRAAGNAPQSRRSARFVSVGQARSVWSVGGFSTALGCGRGISQRDYVIQPSVATTKEGLRWVTEQNRIYPNGVESICGNTDTTALR